MARQQAVSIDKDYAHAQKLRIFVGTWNINGQPANNVSLTQWLSRDFIAPDLYAIGFQELDLSKENFLFNESSREEEWSQIVEKSLHPNAVYEQVALVRLVGIMLIIYSQVSLMIHIKNVSVDTEGTGIMHIMVSS